MAIEAQAQHISSWPTGPPNQSAVNADDLEEQKLLLLSEQARSRASPRCRRVQIIAMGDDHSLGLALQKRLSTEISGKIAGMTIIPVNSIEDGRWYAQREQVDLSGQETLFVELIDALSRKRPLTGKKYNHTMRKYVRLGLPWLNKGQLIDIYARLCDHGLMEF